MSKYDYIFESQYDRIIREMRSPTVDPKSGLKCIGRSTDLRFLSRRDPFRDPIQLPTIRTSPWNR